MTAAEEEQESQRVREFQESIPRLCSQLRILTHFYQVRVQRQGAARVTVTDARRQMTEGASFQPVQPLPLGGSLALGAVRPLVALPSRGCSGGRGSAAPSSADRRGVCGECVGSVRDGPQAAGPRRPHALLCFVSFEGLVSDFMFLKVMLVLEIEMKRFYEEFFPSVLVTN